MVNEMMVQAAGAGLVPVAQKEQILAMFSKARPGFEAGVNLDELTVPRVKLLQGLSDEVKADPKNFVAGMIINSVTKESISPVFIPLAKMPTTWIYFNPRDSKSPNFNPAFDKGAVVWQSSDPNDPRVKEHGAWKDDVPPAATEYLNFLVWFYGFSIPCVLGFAKTSLKAGKNFWTMAFGFGGAIYSRKYELTSQSQSKGGNDFYVLNVRPAGPCDPDELEIGQTLYQAFAPKLKDLKVHEPEEDREPGAEG